MARYHHLQPLCHPTKERKALCPKPNDLSESHPLTATAVVGSKQQAPSMRLQFGFLITLPPPKGVSQLPLLPVAFKPFYVTGFLIRPCCHGTCFTVLMLNAELLSEIAASYSSDCSPAQPHHPPCHEDAQRSAQPAAIPARNSSVPVRDEVGCALLPTSKTLGERQPPRCDFFF